VRKTERWPRVSHFPPCLRAGPCGKGSQLAPPTLSHYDRRGRVQMVDVSAKPPTLREAVASVHVKMSPRILRKIKDNPKGDPFEVARIAGIVAAKRTAELIPLCHPVLLSHVDVQTARCKDGVRLTSVVRSTGPTGVEMEAMVAVAVAALTVYDMCKGLDRGIEIQDLRLLDKRGGVHGTYLAGRGRAGRRK